MTLPDRMAKQVKEEKQRLLGGREAINTNEDLLEESNQAMITMRLQDHHSVTMEDHPRMVALIRESSSPPTTALLSSFTNHASKLGYDSSADSGSEIYSTCSSNLSIFSTSPERTLTPSHQGDAMNENGVKSAESDVGSHFAPLAITDNGCNTTSGETIAQTQHQLSSACFNVTSMKSKPASRTRPSILKRTLSEGVKVPVPLAILQQQHHQPREASCPLHSKSRLPQQHEARPGSVCSSRPSILKQNCSASASYDTHAGFWAALRKSTNKSIQRQPSLSVKSPPNARHRHRSGEEEAATRVHRAPRRRLSGNDVQQAAPPRSACGVSNSHSDLFGSKPLNATVCTCSPVASSRTKSVQILTPTKSKEILYDPTESVSTSFISKKPKSNKTMLDNACPLPPEDVNVYDSFDWREEHCYDHHDAHSFYSTLPRISERVPGHQVMEHVDGNRTTPIDYCPGNVTPNTPRLSSSSASTVFPLTNSQASLYHEGNDATVVSMPPDLAKLLFQANASTPIQQQTNLRMEELAEENEDEEGGEGVAGEMVETSSSGSEEERPNYCRTCKTWFHNWDASYPSRCVCAGLGGDPATPLSTLDTGSIYSINMQKDYRYYLQHPYSRLFVAYCVIFCNFLIFAEDPLSHSQIECSIPILGNVISFLFTKYPPQTIWAIFKACLALAAIVLGLVLGKYILHHLILRNWCRLKMFRNESGTWMIMLISAFFSLFIFSNVYNFLLVAFYSKPSVWLINSQMGISYACFMKLAACGTWMGDFFTAWMITDMMLQDHLYPWWAQSLRAFWHKHNTTRIVIFWLGAIVIASTVISIILCDVIVWDELNQGLVSTTELSRAFLASAILAMDLLIVIQDWDFPHFVCDLNIKLPGLLSPSYTINIWGKPRTKNEIELKISGKWFNYGIIVFVMMLDLNMWKNQVIYFPQEYGQYVHPVTKAVYTVNESITILANTSHIAFEQFDFKSRFALKHPSTNASMVEHDLVINARYVGYSAFVKSFTLIPIALGFVMFFTLIYLHGRYPPKTDRSAGGRYKKRSRSGSRRSGDHKSTWRRERRDDDPGVICDWPAMLLDNVRHWAVPNRAAANYELAHLSSIRECEHLLQQASQALGFEGETLLAQFRHHSLQQQSLISQIVLLILQQFQRQQYQNGNAKMVDCPPEFTTLLPPSSPSGD